MTRVFSGIQPTGEQHLGNFLGATRNWARRQHETDAFFCVVDLHALTIKLPDGDVRDGSVRLAQMLMAVGLDPEVCTLFVQSHVREHSELAWLMQCNVSFGELSRMTQFKDKSDQHDFVSAGLFTYPALQAADIVLYDTNEVPVGDDQRQHIEITRDIAERFNSHYGETFVLPKAVIPETGARVMDLQNPSNKMSKSSDSPKGTIGLLDDPKQIEKRSRVLSPIPTARFASTSPKNRASQICCRFLAHRLTAILHLSPSTTHSTGRSKPTRLLRSSN